ncbi:hypothetical protein P153DRAFT_431449 [Dothidotthia symphoricarpi CBS 119687]|uniref:EamA domain-containing protein n=1 Tax=Dothidotthia symphoricarpi CBS 119687 TaxID=1392245 RepID=A0A6A6AEH3_9PLEO|nr:uncharacterized protein P153DRAFT_431449 [Dothidotthia symphoricarpi CBS 119687]KAF2129505.1 hypothetical protein P153DRAFT_431449 [Dothidotthia symphoricarpi CBS 119687]
MSTPKTKSAWLMLAITSGACAAFNGVFAKLTTTELTASWSSAIASAFGLSPSNKPVEFAIRGLFFALNLVFNAVMWGLFTRALTLASSTVRVSIINTSANFMVTAVLGFLIFNEKLPGLWWLGASLLVAGSVIIGMREEGEKKPSGEESLLGGERDGNGFRDSEEEERVELDSVMGTEQERRSESEEESSDEDAVLR